MKKLLLVGVLLVSCASAAPKVSVRSLLEEMVDRENITRLPDPAFTVRLHSSYDRETVGIDEPGWFANSDRSEFVRVEENAGRKEYVAMDAQGPGAIVRWWVTIAGSTDGSGVIRVYIDGKLAVEGKVVDVVSGEALCAKPLSASVSEKTPYMNRGHNLYLPIPYAKSCKITYESDKIKDKRDGEAFYYNIEARTYPKGVEVESFSLDVARRDAVAIAEINRRLAGGERGLLSLKTQAATFDGVIPPGGSITKTVKGEQAVRSLAMALDDGKSQQALRSTIIEMAFDGQRTVWVPAGEFFGTGYQVSPYQMWYASVRKSGLMEAAWVMPFKKECTLTIRNVGNAPVTVSQSALVTAPYKWDSKRSMYFGAGWYEQNKVSSRKDGSHWDLNYVTLTGEGVLVGTGVTLFNTANAWWGEGDEKIFVDGEAFPSFIGTGSEDYYGYAWSNGNNFDHPFIAQPEGIGAGRPGLVINTRHRVLDAIPFKKSIQFDMEMWHWADTILNYAPVTQWYMRPGGTANRTAEAALAALPVALSRRDIIPLKTIREGRLEGEELDLSATQGSAGIQTDEKYGWSGGKQFWWRGAKPGATANLDFALEKAGKYNVKISFTHAPDYGTADVSFNGSVVAPAYDAYAERVENHVKDFGTLELKEGENRLSIKLTGANAKTKNDAFLFGIDYIDIKRVGD
ncbi:MAG: DUF2961 domain-containing protein [Kiritimatiellaeota bacterium]|nr:DUF2961 domain-containing protein [Kiritimatiellota bacterium]